VIRWIFLNVSGLLPKNPVTCITTTGGNQPRVRAFALWFTDMRGLFYHTGTPESVCQQLKKNPKAQPCFSALCQWCGRTIRVSVKEEFLLETL
jgi:pyridoxamine 5'-phosphate oxidase